MAHNFSTWTTLKYCLILLLCCVSQWAYSQSSQQDAKQHMKQLSFLTGEWIGTSTAYEDGEIAKQGAAYEHIYYDLDSSILVIQLNSEFLQLHTIIRYDEDDETFYYHPFYKRGTNRYPASMQDGQLVVRSSETKRFIFTSTEDGGFREYGEQLVDGTWVKYFEDTFKNSQ